MRLNSEQRISAPRQRVWEALNDTEVLRKSIPGCESITWLNKSELAAAVTAKVGSVKAKFTGKITLSDVDPPNGYRMDGEGQGGAAGFAKGRATVTLHPEGSETLLRYSVEVTVGGKLAQIGSRLVDAAARKMAEDFFRRFNDLVSIAPSPEVEDEPVPERGLPPVVWVPVLIMIVGVLLYVFTQN